MQWMKGRFACTLPRDETHEFLKSLKLFPCTVVVEGDIEKMTPSESPSGKPYFVKFETPKELAEAVALVIDWLRRKKLVSD